MQIAFDEVFKRPLPRTTDMQSDMGESVDYENREFGDLVFFKTGIKVRHVVSILVTTALCTPRLRAV
ncbi:hypothetical protein JCM19231_1104 [Vibrio ishigakensis]|uniref:NlpC/P60 domain-containing protein n=1 Tax=Vibrio ishigakensis TaxID=1481914 RepID=A0A0B8NX21_9VIBR|nr:hypothetical protein JCM19231_1104 [Vibrio ishigakensis]